MDEITNISQNIIVDPSLVRNFVILPNNNVNTSDDQNLGYHDTDNLYELLFQMNPSKVNIYYNQCVRCNIDEKQLLKLKEFHINRMFPDDQIGLMADFTDDYFKWKHNLNTSSAVYGQQCSSNFVERDINPNEKLSLLTIIRPNNNLSQKAATKGQLNQKERIVLLDLIRSYFVNQRMNRMTYEEMEQISGEIEQYFDKEAKTVYFKRELKVVNGNNRLRASGKLLDKWNNRKEKVKESIKSTDVLKRMYLAERINLTVDEDMRKDLELIRLNLSALQSFSVDYILDDWVKSFQLRYECIGKNLSNPSKVFEDWPYYTHDKAIVLVHEDFTRAFPGIVENISILWDKFYKVVYDILKEHITDDYHRVLFNKLDKPNLSADAKNALLLYLLPSYLKPTGRPQQSIATAQDAFIKYTDNVAELEIPNKHPPCIVINTTCNDGSNENDKEVISQIIAYCDGHNYTCTTIIEAIAAVYKFYWLLGIKYPKATHNVWTVIQKAFYSMTYIGDGHSPAAEDLLRKI